MTPMKAIAILISLLFISFPGFSQDTGSEQVKRQPYVHLLYHNGVFWSQTENLKEQFEEGYWGLEARLGFQTTGRKMWQQFGRYPKLGLGIYYADLVMNRRDTVVGNPFALYTFYNAPFYQTGRFTFSTDMSVGLSYTPIVSDPIENPYNDVLASHINLFFGAKIDMDVKLTNRLDVTLGYGLTHHSNGRIHVPQKGVNTWGLSLGMSYMLVEPFELIYREPPEFKSSQEIQFMVGVGTLERIPDGQSEPNRYFNASFTTDYAYKFNPRMALTFGIDIFYNGSTALSFPGAAPEDVATFQKMYLGSHLGYQMEIDRVTLMFNFGTYFWQHSNYRGFFFARAGGRIRVTKRAYAHIAIKTKNGVRSDWIEWGVAYHLRLK